MKRRETSPPLPAPLTTDTGNKEHMTHAKGEPHNLTGTKQGPQQVPRAWTLTRTPGSKAPLWTHPLMKTSHPRRPDDNPPQPPPGEYTCTNIYPSDTWHRPKIPSVCKPILPLRSQNKPSPSAQPAHHNALSQPQPTNGTPSSQQKPTNKHRPFSKTTRHNHPHYRRPNHR
jgi:hypothetical protein